MRVESSVTSVSWIPSEAVTGAVLKGTFESGFTHYDDPPPDTIDDLEELRAAGAFRFANNLAAWVDVQRGRIVDAGYEGGGLMGATTVRLARLRTTFQPVPLPDIRHEPERSESAVRFVQTTGGRTGLPAPRRVNHPPFLQFKAPTVWTTLALTIRADGTSSSEVLGASKFPRHWVYDDDGELTAKVGLADFKNWYRDAFGKHTPWGDRDSKALVTAVESALERQLSTLIMRGSAKPGDPLGEEGHHARRAGRVGHRPVPRARRRARRAGRRRAGRRARPGRDPRRARGAGGRDAHGVAGGHDRLPGGRRARRPGRPRRARAARRGPPTGTA